jgi:AcrR family transcriptional regulator
VVIAARLCRFLDAVLSQLLYPATWWLQKVSKALSKDFPDSFDRTVQRFIDVVKNDPAHASSAALGSNHGRDWVTEAINSPVGHVIQALLNDVRIDSAPPGTIRPCLERIQQCLALSGDPRRHAIALASLHLGWFHRMDPEWTERHLLSILDADDDGDRDSLWAGFFWDPRISSPELYFRMKDGLLNLAKQGDTSREGHVESLAYLTLLGWVSSDGDEGRRWVSDAEFREVLLHGGDEFRSHVLWQVERALSDDDPAEREEWQPRASEFFNNVWPRQKSVKTSRMTKRLCEFLVSHCESFAALIDVVSPLLTTIADETGLHIHFRSEVNELVKAHPERFLHLLHTVLPDNVQHWPYGISDALEMIAEADEALLADARLLELRRMWNAR